MAPTYFVGFVFTSNLGAEDVTVGEAPVGDADTNTIYLDEMSLRYSAVDSEGNRVTLTRPSVDVPIYGVVPPNAQGVVGIPLLTSDVAREVGLSIGTSSRAVSITTTITFSGKTLSGSDVESNEITFPVTAVVQAPCGEGERLVQSSLVCPVGQDGAAPECEEIPTTP